MFSMSGLYLLALASSVYGENPSLQFVNSMNCIHGKSLVYICRGFILIW